MISLLVTMLVVVVIAWLAVYLVSTMPGAPPFLVALIWVVAVLIILVQALRLTGYPGALH